MLRRPFAVLLMLTGAALLSSCGGEDPASAAAGGKSGRPGGSRGGDARGGPPGAASLPTRQVRVTQAELAPLARTVVVSGTLAADEEAELGLKVAGRLASLAVDLGARVRRGQPLARALPHRLPAPRPPGRDRPGAGARPPGPPAGQPGPAPSIRPTPRVVKQAAATLNQARSPATAWPPCSSSS